MARAGTMLRRKPSHTWQARLPPRSDPLTPLSRWHEGLGEGGSGREVGSQKARGEYDFLKLVLGSESETDSCFKFDVMFVAPPSPPP